MGMGGGEWLLEGERKFSSYTANSNYKNESHSYKNACVDILAQW